jgi:glycosyltransferase involved in cell wall biosynthesis
MPKLDVFLLCHNRPKLAKKTILSILQQKNQNFKLTISDNSTNNEMELMVSNEFPEINYIRRRPSTPALDHFNQCLSEISHEYFCLFHDDDIMLPEYTESIQQAIQAFPETIAFGANALIELKGKLQEKPSFTFTAPFKFITKPQDLLKLYFGRYQSGIAPFPGYVYKRSALKELKFNNFGGKYSDVIWLLKITEQNHITWITKPLFIYRIHGDNDGLIESPKDRLKFLSFLKRNPSLSNPQLIADYRFFLYKKILSSKSRINNTKQLKILNHQIAKFRIYRFLRISDYLNLLKKIIRA